MNIEGATVREVFERDGSSLIFVRVGFHGTDDGETVLWVTNYETEGKPASSRWATSDEIRQARELYGSDDIEIDDGALASRADEGVWVAAWVWLSASDREGIS